MKKLSLLILLILSVFTLHAQNAYTRADSIFMTNRTKSTKFIIQNSTKDSTGKFAKNAGGGLLEWRQITINDVKNLSDSLAGYTIYFGDDFKWNGTIDSPLRVNADTIATGRIYNIGIDALTGKLRRDTGQFLRVIDTATLVRNIYHNDGVLNSDRFFGLLEYGFTISGGTSGTSRSTYTQQGTSIGLQTSSDAGTAAGTAYTPGSIISNVGNSLGDNLTSAINDNGIVNQTVASIFSINPVVNRSVVGNDTIGIKRTLYGDLTAFFMEGGKDGAQFIDHSKTGIKYNFNGDYSSLPDSALTPKSLVASMIAAGTGAITNIDTLNHHPASYYLDRANHTGSQAESTITGLVSDLAGKQATLPVTIQRDHVIYTMGDSFTANGEYQTQLNTSLSGAFKIVNMGISGGLASGMNARFSQVTGGTGEYVIILGGINDIIQGQTASQIETSLQAMYTAAHNAGLKVVAMNIPPFGANANWTSGLETIRGTVNTWISATATNIDYKIDIETALWDPSNHTNLNPTYDSGDGLHPNTTGYDLIGTTIYAGATFTPSVSTPTIEFAGNFYVDQNLGTFANVTHKNLNLNTLNVNGQNLSAGQASSNFASGADGTIAIIAKSSLATQTADILQVQDNAANVSASFALTGQSLKLTPLADATKGLLIKEFSGTYSANPLEIQNSSGTILWRVNNTGLTATTGIFNPTSANNSQILLNAPGIAAQVNTATATDAFSINQQNSSATGNILSLKFAGTAKAQFGIDGRLGLSIASPLAGLDVHTPITATSGAADGVRTTGSLTPDVNGSILSSFTSLGTYQTGASAIAASNVITGGSGGTNGTYGTTSVPIALTGGTGTGASAIITVAGNAVTAVTMVQGGTGYTAGDVISASSASIGNVTGFSFTATVGLTGVVRLNAYFKNQPIAFASISTPSNFISGSAMLFYTSPDLFMRDGATTFNLTHPTTLGTIATGLKFSGSISAAAGGNNTFTSVVGDNINQAAATYTDNSTGSSTTLTYRAANVLHQPTMAATNSSVVYTNAATLQIDGAPTAGTNASISNSMAIYVLGGQSVFNGGVATASSGFFSNANFIGNTVASTTSISQYQFGGSTNVALRAGFYGSTSSTITSGYSYSAVNFASSPLTTANSSTTPWAANVVINSLGTPTLGSGASLTNSAALYVGPSISTATNNYGIYSASVIYSDTRIRLKGYTVATLPTGVTGDVVYVTDALTPASLTTVVGGGAQVVPVFYNGTNWIVQ